MGDVRALLRDELAARRGPEQPDRSSTTRATKKRKLESDQEDIRKKQKPTESPSPREDEQGPDEDQIESGILPDSQAAADTADQAPPPEVIQQSSSEPQPQAVDDDEWAAFEREVAAPSRVPASATAALSTNATISAAPVTASELAARERQERESRTAAQEAETLGDREDATRLLEEEFDEMDELEEKVRKLKEKRDEIRRRKEETKMDTGNGAVAMETGEAADPMEESEDESEPEDEWDHWRFKSRR